MSDAPKPFHPPPRFRLIPVASESTGEVTPLSADPASGCTSLPGCDYLGKEIIEGRVYCVFNCGGQFEYVECP